MSTTLYQATYNVIIIELADGTPMSTIETRLHEVLKRNNCNTKAYDVVDDAINQAQADFKLGVRP